MSEELQAFCVRCRTQRTMLNPQPVYTASGTPGTRGTCAVCGTTLFRMGSTPAHANIPKPDRVEKPKAAGKTRKTAAIKAKTAAARAGKSAKKAKPNGAKSAPARNGKIGRLVIVESPAKARSVGQFLGKGYTVMASKGHVRDLLVSQLSVDVENEFEPKYRVMNDKRDVVKDLKTAAHNADEIYLATDPDREGEAIAWHLIHATEIDEKRTQRVVFHEITRSAIQEAFEHPRPLDLNLVNAQQARRILDRLVGYNITEILWAKVRNRLSAGRVQSIALRLIVDREREIEAFRAQEYWTLDAQLRKQQTNGKSDLRPFVARLLKMDGKEADFRAQADVAPHLAVLEKSVYVVNDVKRGERLRKPLPPFTTSTLQQEASRKLGFSARRTMTVAQQLYEGIDLGLSGSVGLITYMRTDSTNISPQAQSEARDFIQRRYGKSYLPDKAPIYRTKTKGAQEAHEAIRPTSVLREPDSVKGSLTSDQFRLYLLIWQRFVACQMANAVYNTLRVDIDAGPQPNRLPYAFRVSGSTIKFNGFLALYEEARDEDVALDEDEGRILPEMKPGEPLDLLKLLPEQHFTQPPPRYTEASLVRTLEEYGIGRPSTYAPTVAVIQDRDYVTKQDKRLTPTDTGKIVNDLLTAYFPNVMDYSFTALMEDELDEIADGEREWRPMLGDFYEPFEKQLIHARENMPDVNREEPIGRQCPLDGGELVIKYGRFGKFIGCSNYPECRHTEPLLERMGIACPICGATHGGEIVQRRSRKGRTFYGCSRYPNCDFTSFSRPLMQACPHCGGLLVEKNRHAAQCIKCETIFQLDELPEVEPEHA